MSTNNSKCQECGCECTKCTLNQDMHLHVEIENLKQRLVEREDHIVTMETTFLKEVDKFPNGEFFALREELLTWQDKYSRLYEAHKRVQKVNQSLEDKLLKLVDKTETEKCTLTKDVATLSHRLAEANYSIHRLREYNEKYKDDVNLAIQLLQCKPANFLSHRVDSLPNDVQAKVSSYVASKRKPAPEDKKTNQQELRSIKVPIPTFPPTAMVYSIPKSSNPEKVTENESDIEIVSAALVAKILEEREKERSSTKHCDSCTCMKSIPKQYQHSVATQVGNDSLTCIKCFSYLGRNSNSNTKIVPNGNNNKNTFSDCFTRSNIEHHRLCDQQQRIKGPRYCSMRVQSGSKNILLDNVHGNYAPVLYTRQDSRNNSRANSTSSDERKSSSVSESDSSSLMKERVADWVENIDDGDNGDVDNDNDNNENGTQDFAQMETNVKKFLYKNETKSLVKTNINLHAETEI